MCPSRVTHLTSHNASDEWRHLRRQGCRTTRYIANSATKKILWIEHFIVVINSEVIKIWDKSQKNIYLQHTPENLNISQLLRPLLKSWPWENFAYSVRNSEILSGIQLKESGIQLRIGIQNPSSTDKDWNQVAGIRNPRRGIQNPRLSWIRLQRSLGRNFYSRKIRGLIGIKVCTPRV